MKILLVSPEARLWNSRTHIHNGLGYLAGALLAAGYTAVDIYDGAVEHETLQERLTREPVDVVGISAPTPLIYQAWEYARIAKEHGAVTLLGGPHPTLLPDESIQRQEVDFVVRGEAEATLVEWVKRWAERNEIGSELPEARASWGDIRGLSWQDENGRVQHNVARPLQSDLDSIAFPAYHLFKIERYTNLQPLTDGLDPHARAYTIVTSRGCPYQCTYCSKPITGNTWRARSVENVLDEWRMLVEDLGATEIGITDDIWNLNLPRAKALCRGLIARGLNTVPWVTVHGMKVNHTDAELFQLMKQAGCKRVGFGVESGDQEILAHVVKKSQTFAQVRAAFANAKAAGLQTMGFFIYGMPGENEATMEKTTQLALELDPDLAHFMLASPYPGTALWETVQREGTLYARDWQDLAIQSDHAHFDFPGVTAQTVERKWHEAYRRFYFRPKRLWKRLQSRDTWEHLPERVGDALRFFKP